MLNRWLHHNRKTESREKAEEFRREQNAPRRTRDMLKIEDPRQDFQSGVSGSATLKTKQDNKNTKHRDGRAFESQMSEFGPIRGQVCSSEARR